MISSVFGKTKPINYIILLAFLLPFYWFVHLVLFQRSYTTEQYLWNLLVIGVLCLSVFLINFIVSRNKITEANTYAILFFTLFIVLFPETVIDKNAIFCNFFLLLAIRRLISMKSRKETKLKIFDATFWILVSSLFYDWALLFLGLVFMAIYFYEAKNIKNWIVTFVGGAAFLLIVKTLLILIGEEGFLREHYSFGFTFDPVYFFDLGNVLKWLLYFLIMSAIGIWVFLKIGKLGLGKMRTLQLLTIFFYLGMTIGFFETENPGGTMILTFFPASVFLNNFIDTITKIKLREVLLLMLVLVPFLVLLSTLLLN